MYVAVASLLVLPKLPFLRMPGTSMDESILLVYPEMIAAGLVPNRDFFVVYGPGVFELLALVFAVTGPALLAERAVGLLAQLAVVLAVTRLARRHGRAAALAAGTVGALILAGPNLLATAWNVGLALTLWSQVLLRSSTRNPAFVAGLLAGLSTFVRYELVVLHVASVPLLRRRTVLPYAAGVAVGSLPTVAHLWVAGASVYRNVVSERMALDGQLDASLVTWGVTAALGGVLAAAAYLVWRLARRPSRVAAADAFLALAMLPQALQRIDQVHVVAVGCVVAPLALAPLVSGRARRLRWAREPRMAQAVTGLGVVAAAGVWAGVPPSVEVTAPSGRSLYVNPAQAPVLDEYVDAVHRHVKPGARLFVGGNDMSGPVANLIYLYHLLPEYEIGTYYVEIPDGIANVAGSRLPRDIRGADALVLTDGPDDLFLVTPPSGRGTVEATEAVEGFCEVVRLPQSGRLLVSGEHCG